MADEPGTSATGMALSAGGPMVVTPLSNTSTTLSELVGKPVPDVASSRFFNLEGLITEMYHATPSAEEKEKSQTGLMHDRMRRAGVVWLVDYAQSEQSGFVVGLNGFRDGTLRSGDEIYNTFTEGFANRFSGRELEFILLDEEQYTTAFDCLLDPEQRRHFAHQFEAGEDSGRTVLASIIYQAMLKGASDVHFEPLYFEEDIGVHSRVRYRIDGVLVDANIVVPPKLFPGVLSSAKGLANLDITEKRLPLDGALHFTGDLSKYGNFEGFNFRMATMPVGQHRDEEELVVRILESGSQRPGLEDLGYRKSQLTRLREVSSQPNGLILVTGPTGSGKTTTLYSILDELNSPEVKIKTVENPIEINLQGEGISQSQVHDEIGLNFHTALRAFLRQDPDIILVGEMRDKETAQVAVEAALTGHMVFSTLHTNSAIGALMRLYNLEIGSDYIRDTLSAVVAQRLTRKLCTDCCETYDASRDLNTLLGSEVVKKPYELKRATGTVTSAGTEHAVSCRTCSGTGYVGRSVTAELWVPGQEERDLIGRGVVVESEYLRAAVKSGMRPMASIGMQAVMEGKLSVDEFRRVVPFRGTADPLHPAIAKYVADKAQ